MESFLPLVEKSTWPLSREITRNLLPSFAEIIDDINPDESYHLYRVKYPYGSSILNRGVFQLPMKDGILPLSNSYFSDEIKEDLSYTGTIPLALVIDKGVESFVQYNKTILPATFMGKGKFVSLWRVFEEGNSYFLGGFWNISSGVRSICMLPKITDSASHKNLRTKYGITNTVPQNLSDQWGYFNHIANHCEFPQKWYSELLFFSKKWFDHRKDKRWSEFYRYLLNTVWQNSSYRRNQFILDCTFSIVQQIRNLKPNPYLADTARHLIAVGVGFAPGFSVGIDDSAAPISGLQKVYLEDYGLRKYAPVFMHMHHLSHHENRPVYYSFQIPTTTIFSPKSRKLTSAMADLHEVKHVMDTFLNEILRGNLGVEQTPLYDLAENTHYKYYHSEKDKLGDVLSVADLAQSDPFINHNQNDNYFFPEFSPFFKGCIRISRK